MEIKGFIDEDFCNFQLPSMYIAFPHCSFKCDKENGYDLCQNARLAKEKSMYIEKEELIERYLKNDLTKAIVFGGLEPFDDSLSIVPFIDCLRWQYQCNDPIVIYTGYTEEEVINFPCWEDIKKYNNIIIKFGRYRPNQKPHFDEVLGVKLCSDNQYAKEFNHEDTPV
jgi:hypothetical protein